MPKTKPTLHDSAAQLSVGIGVLVRRLRQVQSSAELTIPETSALARLDRGGPMTGAALAKQEQISPQSMGATLAALEGRGLLGRTPDPTDGRRILLAPTPAGLALLRSRRSARADLLADAMATGFTSAELEVLAAAGPLLERLGQQL